MSPPAAPLRGVVDADVAIVGGGYTGLWTAHELMRRDPARRVVVLEADICGGGPSGRNGGFVNSWWDEASGLVAAFGADGARACLDEVAASVDAIGAWCDAARRGRALPEGGHARRLHDAGARRPMGR